MAVYPTNRTPRIVPNAPALCRGITTSDAAVSVSGMVNRIPFREKVMKYNFRKMSSFIVLWASKKKMVEGTQRNIDATKNGRRPYRSAM